MRGRGIVTPQIESMSKDLLGVDINTTQLRLMPYVQYCVMNDQNIRPDRVNQADREVLSEWRQLGFIEGGASGLKVSKEFWDAMHEILWLGYVAYS